jgi:hypothetical protein
MWLFCKGKIGIKWQYFRFQIYKRHQLYFNKYATFAHIFRGGDLLLALRRRAWQVVSMDMAL